MFFNDVSIVTRQEHVFTTDTEILNPQGLIIFFCVVVPGFLRAQVPIHRTFDHLAKALRRDAVAVASSYQKTRLD
jgi:hypothetical protein